MGKTMWVTPSSSLILLLLTCLVKFGEIRAQCVRPVVGENRVLADDSGQTSFPEGSSVKFKCGTGYQPADPTASRTITCSGQQWTTLDLQCKKKSCGSPGELSNGRYLTPDGILFGATATAQCNPGFVVSGTKMRNCVDAGWDGRPAECEVIKCLPPAQIDHGTYEPLEDHYDYLSVVTYTCNHPYSLDGPQTISCSDDATFQPSPPRCVDIKCDAPKIDNAIRIEGKAPPYTGGNFVNYQCNKGYKMKGTGYLVCGKNGWNPPPPVCVSSPGPDPSPGPGPGPSPGPGPEKGNGLAIGLGVAAGLVVLITVIVCCVKKSSGWGKVPTRNEA
ncbi:membrane cofactor protein-like isoform X4 [Silurus meridionalis]|uniref:membrane cofactor protein-like isoform X4 n=1 Tax=Silurus meridionalis TaxID=175797 RepID=UPI001EEBB627|nr:membrane cofactor protein-like isoform X4 [Silurus meridionalis]